MGLELILLSLFPLRNRVVQLYPRTSQETHYVFATEPSRLMLFGETVAVYCENHTEHTDTVRTSQEIHYVSTTEANQLMLYGETAAVYCENHTEHTDKLCGQNAGLYIKQVVHIVTTGLWTVSRVEWEYDWQLRIWKEAILTYFWGHIPESWRHWQTWSRASSFWQRIEPWSHQNTKKKWWLTWWIRKEAIRVFILGY
jgi:hypothetical protein